MDVTITSVRTGPGNVAVHPGRGSGAHVSLARKRLEAEAVRLVRSLPRRRRRSASYSLKFPSKKRTTDSPSNASTWVEILSKTSGRG